jgi:acyl-CoA thioester hydrolase
MVRQVSGASGPDQDPRLLRRSDFSVLRPIPTRWADEDVYGHVNNAVHYQIFDSAVNGWLIETIGDVRALSALGVVAETSCRYLGELRFPELVTVGLALGRLGNRSVTYQLSLFGERGPSPVAVGRFVHVYVDRHTRRPVEVPGEVREALRLLNDASRMTTPAD